MTAYLLLDIDIHDKDKYDTYKRDVPPFVAKHGGQYLARGGEHEVIEGSWHPTRLVLFRFPDRQSIRDLFSDPDYQYLKAIRHGAASSNLVSFDGLDLAAATSAPRNRIEDLTRFYSILDRLGKLVDGPKTLASCSGMEDWPMRGVYFFQELGEQRRESGAGPRIVRVGTHALTTSSRTTLWNRLSQHKGVSKTGGGNHRGSIFRLLVGTAMIARDDLNYPTWDHGGTASRTIRDAEHPLETLVSAYIGKMPFLWLPIEDDAGPSSLRGYVERNAIALLSNLGKVPADPPSREWCGHSCQRDRVRASGLWNQRHVEQDYAPQFLDKLEQLVDAIGSKA